MKWSGVITDLIHQNLNLHINLDDDVKQSPILDLPIEIWQMILEFVSTRDIISFKFLSKRFYRLSFLKKDLKYLIENSCKIFDVNDYYFMFSYFYCELLRFFEVKFDHLTYLFLKFSFEDLKNQITISNCLNHLFFCPRSFYAKNDCLNCSRAYIKSQIIRPKNFNCISDFKFNSFFNLAGLSLSSLDILKQFKILVFFDSFDEYSIINSNRVRCLTTMIFQDHLHLVLVFFEIQLRVFINFFYSLLDYVKVSDQSFFLERCFSFAHKFVVHCIKRVKVSFFQEIFDEIDFNDFNSNIIKIINKKYIDYCNRKYAS